MSPARYAYAEPATGGELFAPRLGDLTRTRAQVDYAVQNWWGGRVDWQPARSSAAAAAPATAGGQMTVRVVVEDGTVVGLVSAQVESAFGAFADAQIYGTAAT